MPRNPMARHLADKRNRQRILPDKRRLACDRQIQAMQREMDALDNEIPMGGEAARPGRRAANDTSFAAAYSSRDRR